MFYSSPTTAEPPFPFNQRRVAVSTANQFNNEDTAFKFDSRLIIVEEKEESYEDDGQDSGIGKSLFKFYIKPWQRHCFLQIVFKYLTYTLMIIFNNIFVIILK